MNYMDPPPSSSSSYSLAEIWPINAREPAGGALGQNLIGEFQRNVFEEESNVTEQQSGRKRRPRDAPVSSSDDESSKLVSTSNRTQMNGGSESKRQKLSHGQEKGNSNVKVEAETSSGIGIGMGVKKPVERSTQPLDPSKQDYIHVRARRGQATDSHSLAERARREKISERMNILQDLVPGCNKVIGKALVLDEIINYIQSLQHQVEFLSMKLEAVNSSTNIEGYSAKDTLDTAGLAFGSQAAGEYCQGSPPEWLHMQIGCGFERET